MAFPAPVKCTLFLEEGEQGWSETYYITCQTFDEAGIAPAAFGTPSGGTVIANRVKLLPAAVQVIGMRASDPANPRASFAFPSNTKFPTKSANRPVGPYFISKQGLYGEGYVSTWPNIQVSEVDTAVKLRQETADGLHRRILLLRGLPETVIGTKGGYLDTVGIWLDQMQAFRVALTQNSIGNLLKVIDGGQPPPSAVQTLTLFAPNYEYIQVTTLAPLMKRIGTAVSPVLIGDRVLIRGYKGGYRINGPWRVIAIDNTGLVYTLGPRRRNVAVNSWTSPGVTIQALNYLYSSVANAFDEGLYVVSRKTGRPFGLLAGRRPAR
jgi:hypothetical protein